MSDFAGAGEGNRTLVVSLGSFCSTIELHPHPRHLSRGRTPVQGAKQTQISDRPSGLGAELSRARWRVHGSDAGSCTSPRESRELDLHRESRLRLHESKLGTMELRHGLHEAEAKAVARRRAAAPKAVLAQ